MLHRPSLLRPGLALLLTATALAPHSAPAQDTPGVVLVDAFPGQNFSRPVLVRHAGDGSGRLFVVEQGGRILLLDEPGEVPAPTLAQTFIDLSSRVTRRGNEQGLLGLAFHPDHATNGRFFVHYSRASDGATVLAELNVGATPDTASLTTERLLLTVPQFATNHNGGSIEFGPDGMLYLGLGDGGGANDPQRTGQDLTRLLGKVLRLDVDDLGPEEDYRVPADNPFVARAGARPEIWAYGLRNPWRFSFDQDTGEMWLADVGQNQFEEVDVVSSGDNLGWSRREGFELFRNDPTTPADPLVDPVHVYDHALGVSITGGYVYRGTDLPTLDGAYLFADFVSGRIWTLRRDDDAVDVELLMDTSDQIASFGEGATGELYICVFTGGGRVLRIDPMERPEEPETLPGLISELPLFRNVSKQRPVAGALRYGVASALWSDGAAKDRFLVLPEGAALDFHPADAFDMPVGGYAVKTFALRRGRAGRARPLETRVIHRTDDDVLMATYVWKDDLSDAVRLDTRLVTDVPGPKGDQQWTYPSPDDCTTCHLEIARTLLGVSARQLRERRGGRSPLSRWVKRGVLAGVVPPVSSIDRNLPVNGRGRLERRARSYLDANCSFCHRPGAPQPAGLDLRPTTDLAGTGLLGVATRGALGVPGGLLVDSGAPDRSVLVERMRIRDGDELQMPRIGSALADEKALRTIERWIRKLD